MTLTFHFIGDVELAFRTPASTRPHAASSPVPQPTGTPPSAAVCPSAPGGEG